MALMNFRVRKISNNRRRSWWQYLKDGLGAKWAWVTVITLLVAGVFLGGSIALNKNLFHSTTQKIFQHTSSLKSTDGRVNILLLGVGGEFEQGGNLSDAILVASLDLKTNHVSFLSIPRDLFIASDIGDRKINEIYAAAKYKSKNSNKGLQVIKDAMSDFIGLNVHYGVVIEFKIFTDIVDAIGGIDVFVREAIYDPFYPDNNYGYQDFIMREGWQSLDGEIALKYVRSRKTTSDYNRAQRQQDVLMAIKNKMHQNNWLTSPTKIKSLYSIFRQRMITDIGLTQAITLCAELLQVTENNFHTGVLNDDPSQPGGLLYTPAQEFFGGQFVLLPESFADTRLFMHLVLKDYDVFWENTQIAVFNGSQIDGLAAENASRLRRLGLHVIEIGNYKATRLVSRSFGRVVADFESHAQTIELLEKMFSLVRVEQESESGGDGLVDFQLILGAN